MPALALSWLLALPVATLQDSLAIVTARQAFPAPVAAPADGEPRPTRVTAGPVISPGFSFASQSDSSLERAIARLSRGQRLRLTTNTGSMVSGSYVRADTMFVIVAAQTERAVPRSSITELWAETRGSKRAATTGAIVGGLVGGTVGLVGGLMCAPACAGHQGLEDALAPGAVGLFVGAAAGWLLGTLVGSTPRWDKLYP